MNTTVLITTIASLVAIIAGAFASMRWILQKGFDAKLDKLEARLEHEKTIELRDRWQPTPITIDSGDRIQREIDTELAYAMNALRATESSLLIPDPAPNSSNLVFISVHGHAAHQIYRSKVGPDSTAGTVLREGKPRIMTSSRQDPSFSSAIDDKSGHITRNMLTIPLRTEPSKRTVGVAQFLNRVGNDDFTQDDAREAMSNMAEIAVKVDSLARNPENLKSLGLLISSDDQRGTMLFCDLSSSARLFKVLDDHGAINYLDEYLTRITDVALRHGGSLEKYLGDGAMFRFNDIPGDKTVDHTIRAAEAAFEMHRNFDNLTDSWPIIKQENIPLNIRSGLATGVIHESVIGHRMSRHIEILGETVNRAAHLCELATRNRSSIVIDESLEAPLQGEFTMKEIAISNTEDRKAYELLRRI